jgi:hypothetical protein
MLELLKKIFVRLIIFIESLLLELNITYFQLNLKKITENFRLHLT